MRFDRLLSVAGFLLMLAGCAERPLPTWETPLAKTQFQRVRTTAYFDGEADHLRYTNHNALGTTLQCGTLNSAAADWSRWPAGTMFRILETGRTYVVDDYGWALAGRNTIDLYMPTRGGMDAWGLRYVDIQILQWGDPVESYHTLLPRSSYRHVRRMVAELKPELNNFPVQIYSIPGAAPEVEPQPVVASSTRRQQVRSAQAVGVNPSGVALTPFY